MFRTSAFKAHHLKIEMRYELKLRQLIILCDLWLNRKPIDVTNIVNFFVATGNQIMLFLRRQSNPVN